ncbi:MAG: SNF2-related protein [Paludibacter sp.]
MKQQIVYTLSFLGNLGAFPECMVVDTDEKGVFASHYVKVSSQNKSNYIELFDETDHVLVALCLKLEKETIVSKTKDRNARTWDNLMNKYFSGAHIPELQYIKEYLLDYIESIQQTFFEKLADRPIYLPQGKFPFTWIRLSVEEEMPELLYCFDNQADWIYYSLEITCRNKQLSLLKANLVSRKRARVLLKNKIYEFDNEVDGAKLVPFFNKEKVSVSQANAEEYIQKVIMPLTRTNKVLANGFEIQSISEISSAVLRIKELVPLQQLSLFEDEKADIQSNDVVLELIFEYQNFKFWAGQSGATTKLELEDTTFNILKVERDSELEKLYIESLKEIGLNFDGKVHKIPYNKGFDWINDHYKQIESTGIEIRYENKSNSRKPLMLGEREIKIELVEGNDWFDLKGSVRFGKYEIPFLRVLNYIKQNKHEMLLPTGEYVQIPQSWFDEYKSLVDLCKIENGIATVSKHYCVMLDEMVQASKLKWSIKENMRNFIEHNVDLNYDLPQKFNGELRHYQQQGYNWLRLLNEMNLGGCLADDMGLGKTIQTLCLLQWLKENDAGTSLLVVPTSLVYNWQQEASKFTPELSIYVHVGNNRTQNASDFGQPDLLLTSYAILRRDKHLFTNQHFNYIVLDEAQSIKNPQSDITQVCLSLSAKQHLTLTGTPIENSLTDLWSQVHFFNRNMLGSANHFMRSCKQPEKQALYRQLIRPFLLRRHKNAVLTDLPEKTIIIQPCEMSDEQQRFYRDIRNSYLDKFLESKDENNKISPIVLLEGLLRLRQSANHPKLVDAEYPGNSGKFEIVTQLLEDVVQQGDKVLIFSSFVEHLKLYKNYLDEREIQYCYLDGSTKDRKEQVEKFQNDDDSQVFLLSLKAGGVGLNLTRASYVFLLDPWWNPAAEAQAYDRAHRIGQKNKVFVYKFITQNSIEEKILKLQERKILLSETMLENETTEILKQLDIDEVMMLIN